MIEHLEAIKDPLIRKFRENEIQPIKDNSAYHSPELSETDGDEPGGKRNIIVKDLKWHSETVRLKKFTARTLIV